MNDGNDKGRGRPGRPGAGKAGPRGGATRRPEGRHGSPERPDRHEAGARPEAGSAPAEIGEIAGAAPAHDRIAKVIARAGIASRRDAEAMIAEGRVTLNGAVLASPAQNVGPEDVITVDGEKLPSRERTRLWLFHKPRGLVTTFRDPEGRPTVFEALPEDMPRVVAIGRLDINTEGLLLLTNDGGLAKVIAQPQTGWTRRYRVRAHGEVSQANLDKLKGGIVIDGVEYGGIDAQIDRVQGDNIWLTLALREGKNREVKRVLEHLGIQVNRLIRLSFGPFQLGELEQGLVEEVRTRVLKDQLGAALAEEAGVDFESPVREPIAPMGKPGHQARPGPERAPRPRQASGEARGRERPSRFEDRPGRTGDRPSRPGDRQGRFDDRQERPGRRDERRPEGERGPREAARRGAAEGRVEGRRRPSAWRAGEDTEGGERPRRHAARREDPKADRVASAARSRERVGKIEAPGGTRVLVERVVRARSDQAEARPRRDAADRKPWGGAAPKDESRKDRPGKGFGGRPGRSDGPPGGRGGPPGGRGGRPGRPGGAPRPGAKTGGRPGFRPKGRER